MAKFDPEFMQALMFSDGVWRLTEFLTVELILLFESEVFSSSLSMNLMDLDPFLTDFSPNLSKFLISVIHLKF